MTLITDITPITFALSFVAIAWISKDSLKFLSTFLAKEFHGREKDNKTLIYETISLTTNPPPEKEKTTPPDAPNNSKLGRQVQVMDERLIQIEHDYLALLQSKGFEELMEKKDTNKEN